MPIELPSGSCMLVKKDVFAAIGNFDPATFLYYEENILYRKLLKLKLGNYIATGLRCVHPGAATMAKSPSKIVAQGSKGEPLILCKDLSRFSVVAAGLVECE